MTPEQATELINILQVIAIIQMGLFGLKLVQLLHQSNR